VHAVETLPTATANDANVDVVFAEVPAQEVMAVAVKSGVIVAAGRGTVVAEQVLSFDAAAVTAATLQAGAYSRPLFSST